MQDILRALWGLRVYNIYWDLINTACHGLPHHRLRFFFIGILRVVDLGFSFPPSLPQIPLEALLDRRDGRPSFSDLPPPTQSTARANLLQWLHHLIAKGHDPFSELWVLDIDASSAWEGAAMANCSPCLIRSRANGFWLSNRGRRMNIGEMMRLQGVPPTFAFVCSEHQMGQQLGNSMSVNVLARLLARLLPAAQLSGGQALSDPYSGCQGRA